MSCTTCTVSIRNVFLRKLGRCAGCMQISALVFLAAWIAAALAHPGTGAVSLLLAGSLSLPFLAHTVAFTRRASALRRAAAFNLACETGTPWVETTTWFSGLADLLFALAGPILAVVESGRSRLGDDKRPGDDCQKDEKGPVIKCNPKECLPLHDKDGKEYKGECKLIEKSRGKKPIAWECLCIYQVKSECRFVEAGPDKHPDCDGECPDLFLTDPTKDKKAAAVDKECTMIVEHQDDGSIKLVCICTYF